MNFQIPLPVTAKAYLQEKPTQEGNSQGFQAENQVTQQFPQAESCMLGIPLFQSFPARTEKVISIC